MTSIIISSDELSLGETVAKAVATQRDMTYIDRDIIEDIGKTYGVDAGALTRLLDFRGRFNASARHRLACLKAGVYERFLEDNIVCTGLAAHLYVRNISHVLNVRVLSDMASLTHRLAAEKDIAPKRVRSFLEKKMRRRRDYTLTAFEVDETNPASYDMVFTLGKFDIDGVVKTIIETADDRKFTPMTYSTKCMADLAAAGRVRLALDKFSKVTVAVNDGTATLSMNKGFGWKKRAEALRRCAREVDGITDVRIHLAGDRKEETPKTKDAVA